MHSEQLYGFTHQILCGWSKAEAEVGGACGKHRGEEKWVRTFGRTTKVKKPLARSKFKLGDNIQMDPKETRVSMDLIRLA